MYKITEVQGLKLVKRSDFYNQQIINNIVSFLRPMKHKEKYKLFLIEWEDSILGYQGWKTIKEEPNRKTILYSVGFLVKQNKRSITLFPHISKQTDNKSFGSGDILIPKSAIRKIKQLKY
jgi:hypothetical protein